MKAASLRGRHVGTLRHNGIGRAGAGAATVNLTPARPVATYSGNESCDPVDQTGSDTPASSANISRLRLDTCLAA